MIHFRGEPSASNHYFTPSRHSKTLCVIKSCVTFGLVALSGASARTLRESPTERGTLDVPRLETNHFNEFDNSAQRSLREISPPPAVILAPAPSQVLAPAPSAAYCVYKEAFDAFTGILNMGVDDPDGTENARCPDGGRFIIDKFRDSEFSSLASGELIKCRSGSFVFNGNFTNISGSWDEDEMFNVDISGSAEQHCDVNIVSVGGGAGLDTFCDIDFDLIQNNC